MLTKTDSIVPLPDPIARDRKIAGIAVLEGVAAEHRAVTYLVGKIKVLIRCPIYTGAIQAIAIPTARQSCVARNTQNHRVIGKASRQIVLEVDQPVRWSEHANAK